MMTEQQMIEAFAETTVEHTKDGIMMGLHPVHVANVLMLASIRLAQELHSKAEIVAGLRLAAEKFENG
jgi:hypothetical protein